MDVYIDDIIKQLEHTKKVNPYAINELQYLLERGETDFDEIERLCFSIVTNLFDDEPILELQKSNNKILWYDYLKLQLYFYFKGKGDYGDNRTLLAASSALIIESAARELFIKFGIHNELIPLVVSLFLCIAMKTTTQAWCGYFYDKTIRNNKLLRDALEEVTDQNDSGKV